MTINPVPPEQHRDLVRRAFGVALDRLAEIERRGLGPHGLKAAMGYAPLAITQLPTSLRWWENAAFQSVRQGAAPTGAHPGGFRRHVYNLATVLVLAPIGDDPIPLSIKAGEWTLLFDELYSNNTTVDGLGHVALGSAEYGTQRYGDYSWWAIKFPTVLTLTYLMANG